MFAINRHFSMRGVTRVARLAALICAMCAPGPVLASPVSMLDADAATAATSRPLNIPKPDNASTVRPIAPLPAPTAGASAPSFNAQPTAPSAAQTPASAGLVPTAPATEQSGAGTLREVLASIVTLHQSDGKASPAPRLGQARILAKAAPGSSQDELNVDLRKLILDSEVAGTMLRSIVEIKSADAHGATFSIFGLGNFALDVAPDLNAAIVSELSSGMSFRMALLGDAWNHDGLYPQATLNGDNGQGVQHEHVNLMRVIWTWILDFLNSPVGALVSMAIAIALFLWIGVKSVGFLQRRASRYEH
jgi:hypothetical protein